MPKRPTFGRKQKKKKPRRRTKNDNLCLSLVGTSDEMSKSVLYMYVCSTYVVQSIHLISKHKKSILLLTVIYGEFFPSPFLFYDERNYHIITRWNYA